METDISFGTWVRRQRRALDLTQEALARRVGCARITIQKIEAGERRPSREFAALLAERLAVPPDKRDAFLRAARSDLAAPQLDDPARLAATSDIVRSQTPGALPSAAADHLPAYPTSFIGRERELADLRRRLTASSSRLTTLIGPPGIGKTRLALAVVGEVQDSFPDGVYVVPLAPVGDPDLVLTTIAYAMNLWESGDQPASTRLNDYLRHKQLLLILDNFEQIITAAPQIADLLAVAPALKVLVTSRAALRVRGEHLFPVPALQLADTKTLPPAELLTQIPTIALFVDRAQAVRPDFALTTDNAEAVATICARLDGLPLAIELAAARMRLLSPQTLLARLNSGLAVVANGPRDVPPRHRTLRAAIEWSYSLLPVDEQALFRRLAVFVSGCSLEAAEAVLSDDRWLALDAAEQTVALTAAGILEGLASLVDKSLLAQIEDQASESRFTMLATIHEYAQEQLVASGEAEVLRQRLAMYYVRLVEQAEPELHGPHQVAWLGRLEAEYPNLRAVMGWGEQHPETDTLARLLAALELFWVKRGHLAEARGWVNSALARSGSAPPTLLDLRLRRAALFAAWLQGDMVVACAQAAQGLALAQQIGDMRNIALALVWQGWMEYWVQQFDDAYPLLEQSVQAARASGDPWVIAMALTLFGHELLRRGNVSRACDLFAESLGLLQRIGDPHLMSFTQEFLGHSWMQRQRPDCARIHYEEALAMRRTLNDRWSIGWALKNLGEAELATHNLERAGSCFAESLVCFRELGTHQSVVEDITRRLEHLVRHAGDVDQTKAR